MRTHPPAANAVEVIPDFNPYLEAHRAASPNQVAGAGHIFKTGDRNLIMWQTRPAMPSAYERALADALEQIFAQQTYDLPGIVAALNGASVRTPGGEAWTEQNFQDTLRELGQLAFG
jgi:hypothetical protein